MKSKRTISGKNVFGWLLICISVLMLGKSVSLCFSSDIWYDELFTVGMIEHSYSELIQFTAADVHPPLYYCVTKFLVDLCKLFLPGTGTVIPAKMVSVLPYFILFLYSVTFVRKRFGIFTGGMFLFCVISMPQMSAYTVEVRMYGWALLFVTAAFFHAYGCVTAQDSLRENERTVKEEGNNVGLTGSQAPVKFWHKRYIHGAALVFYGLAAAYTQYFACVAVVMVYLYVLAAFCWQDKKRVKEWFLYVALSVAGYVPWLFALAAQISAVRENYWILPLTWRSLGGCVKFLMKPAFTNAAWSVILAVVLSAGYAVVVMGSFWAGMFDRNKKKVYYNGRVFYAIAGLGVLAGLVIFGFIASILVRPVFVYRYMIPAMGCFWLCFVLCLDDILCKLSTRCVTVMLGGFTALLCLVGLRDYRAFLGEEEYKILLMKDTVQALDQIGAQDIVIFNFDQVQAVTSYYLPDETEPYLWNVTAEQLIQQIVGPCGTVEKTDDIKAWLLSGEAKEEALNRRIWFVGSFNSREDIVAQWRKEGLHVEECGSYLLERYWFNLYEISI